MSNADQIPSNFNIEINENDGRTFKNKLPNCLKNLIKIIFSTPGLVILVVLYSAMGAFIFPILEAPSSHIKNNMALTTKPREDCLRELWTITEKLNVLYEKHWKELIDKQLRRFESTIVASTRNGAASITEYNKTTKWSFSEALLYSVTVITTIGHGHLTPKTSAGKIVTIFYAIIGVPLMLMCLASLGELLAEVLQYSYIKFCCARNRKNPKSCTANSCFRSRGTSGGDSHSALTSYNGTSSHEIDCTICKYDALETETKLHNNYEYIAVNERDGIRRDKLIPKPLPHEINIVLAESDFSSSTFINGNDLFTNINISPNNSICPLVNEQTVNYSGNACKIVDIIEDEEESDQNRGINLSFLHGTPSKIPLLPQSSSASGSPSHQNNSICIEFEKNPNNYYLSSIESKCYGNKNLSYDKNQDNGLINNSSVITTFKQQNNQDQSNQHENLVNDHQHDIDHMQYDHHHYHDQEQQQVPITIIISILTGYIFLGTIIFAFWENWSFIDGAYFCFVTLSTIGYGDFLPLYTFHHGPDVQLLACCIYLLIGLILVAMSFNILETKLMWKCKRIAVRLKLAKD